MLVIDWSLVLSAITATAAVAALFFTGWQIRQNNKQSLFDRRVCIYTRAHGLMELYGANKHLLEIRAGGPETGLFVAFTCLVNNSYLCDCSTVVGNVDKQGARETFLRKMEELKEVAFESQLAFRGNCAENIHDFVYAYQETLMAMYRYQILMQEMEQSASRFHWELEEAVQGVGEPSYRQRLYDSYEALDKAYDSVVSSSCRKALRRQCRLS